MSEKKGRGPRRAIVPERRRRCGAEGEARRLPSHLLQARRRAHRRAGAGEPRLREQPPQDRRGERRAQDAAGERPRHPRPSEEDRRARAREDAAPVDRARAGGDHEPQIAPLRGGREELESFANLYVASYQLHSSLRLPSVVRHMKELLAQLVGARSLAIYFADEEKRRLVPIGSDGVELGSLPAIPLRRRRRGDPAGRPSIERVFLTGSRTSRRARSHSPAPAACIPLQSRTARSASSPSYAFSPRSGSSRSTASSSSCSAPTPARRSSPRTLHVRTGGPAGRACRVAARRCASLRRICQR
jgi:hypothetical protein